MTCKYKLPYAKHVFFILSLLTSSCIEFRISDEDAKEKLADTGVSIQFDDLLVGERNMHFAFNGKEKENLIVFVHGSPGSWNAFIDFFKADSILGHANILAVDRPGYGKSGYGLAEPALKKQAMLIKEVIGRFDHSKIILIGHSLGGPVIARMAMDYPSLFNGLIMVAPSIDPEMEKDEWYRRVINTKLGAAVTPEEFKVSNDEILPLKEELIQMLPLWHKIRIPTIVIQGTKDRLVPRENADFAEKMLPDAVIEIRLLEGVDHFIPWSHPYEIISAIQQMLDGAD